ARRGERRDDTGNRVRHERRRLPPPLARDPARPPRARPRANAGVAAIVRRILFPVVAGGPMNWHDGALGLAGVLGSGGAVLQGRRVQRLMVEPLKGFALADRRAAFAIRRLVPMLLHFSTASWFLGGLALIVAAIWFAPGARLATGACVGALYLYGAA